MLDRAFMEGQWGPSVYEYTSGVFLVLQQWRSSSRVSFLCSSSSLCSSASFWSLSPLSPSFSSSSSSSTSPYRTPRGLCRSCGSRVVNGYVVALVSLHFRVPLKASLGVSCRKMSLVFLLWFLFAFVFISRLLNRYIASGTMPWSILSIRCCY